MPSPGRARVIRSDDAAMTALAVTDRAATVDT